MRLLDRILTGALAALVFLTPLAFGCVHPWAFRPMEAAVFGLVIVWMAKVALGAPRGAAGAGPAGGELRGFPPPISLFLALAAFQLLALPPSAMRMLSPATYRLYAKTIPGWPDKTPYAGAPIERVSPRKRPSETGLTVLPSPEQVRRGYRAPFAPDDQRASGANLTAASSRSPSASGRTSTALGSRGGGAESRMGGDAAWRPLSVAPALTGPGVVMAFACAGLFLLMVGYPFDEPDQEGRFYRAILLAVLAGGFLVAAIGIAQRASWNGKILWFFVPGDWAGGMPPGLPRASGPFVDPDHFANYLAMIFPLAVAGAFFRTPLKPRRSPDGFQVLCGAAAFLMLAAILLSLSRAGWIATALGMVVFSLLVSARGATAGAQEQVFLSGGPKTSRYLPPRPLACPLWLSVAGLSIVVILALAFAGPVGTSQAELRLGEALANSRDAALGERLSVWRDSLAMVRDFPLLGVGLGVWPELFPHYQSRPWAPLFFRRAHNDYLQLLAETGFLGLGLLAWAFLQAIRRFLRAPARLAAGQWPLFAALASALAATALHEFFDFSLHTPANAFLFTLLLALAVRMASGSGAARLNAEGRRPGRYAIPVLASALAMLLIIAAVEQNAAAYPNDIKRPHSGAEAVAVVLAHPASSTAHLALARFMPDTADPPWRLGELATAVWLAPADPYRRDRYVQGLLAVGREPQALAEITKSVFNAPALNAHFYLAQKYAPWLTLAEQKAVADGFRDALAASDAAAAGQLAEFYGRLGRYAEEARVYAAAARQTREPARRALYLAAGGEAYAKAGRTGIAERLLRQAIAAEPKNPGPYQALIALYAVRKDIASAKAVAADGVRDDAAPSALLKSLADAAEAAGDIRAAEAALRDAVKYQPSLDAVMRLGLFRLQHGNLDGAVATLREATEIDPNSPDAFYNLALAEERNYQYVAAGQDYARAAKLAPGNRRLRRRYGDFRRRMSAANYR